MHIARLDISSRREFGTRIVFGRCSPLPKLLSASIVPFGYLYVWDEREGFLGKGKRECCFCERVYNGEEADSILYERNVFFWSQEYLDTLPAYKAFRCEGWDRWRSEVVRGGEEGVLAAY